MTGLIDLRINFWSLQKALLDRSYGAISPCLIYIHTFLAIYVVQMHQLVSFRKFLARKAQTFTCMNQTVQGPLVDNPHGSLEFLGQVDESV